MKKIPNKNVVYFAYFPIFSAVTSETCLLHILKIKMSNIKCISILDSNIAKKYLYLKFELC